MKNVSPDAVNKSVTDKQFKAPYSKFMSIIEGFLTTDTKYKSAWENTSQDPG